MNYYPLKMQMNQMYAVKRYLCGAFDRSRTRCLKLGVKKKKIINSGPGIRFDIVFTSNGYNLYVLLITKCLWKENDCCFATFRRDKKCILVKMKYTHVPKNNCQSMSSSTVCIWKIKREKKIFILLSLLNYIQLKLK